MTGTLKAGTAVIANSSRHAGTSATAASRRRARRAAARRLLAVALALFVLALSVGAGMALTPGPLVAIVVLSVVGLWPSTAGRWAAGAAGERATARALEGVERDGYTVLHDVRLRGRTWNLDHVLLGPAGVVLVESKQWRRRVTVARRWPKVVEQHVGWQIDAVAAALRDAGLGALTVHAFLCVHGTDVRRRWWTGARSAPVGDGCHLRRWLRRLPPTSADAGPARKVFESQA